MAGRFLTLEETAMKLGVEPDEINRLVDRKKLFPMRDGGTMKFRYDDVVRYAETKGESSDATSGLSLDFDMAGSAAKPASGLELDLEGVEIGDAVGDGSFGDGASIFDDPGPAVSKIVSETVLRGGSIDASGLSIGSGASIASGASLPGISNASGVAISDELLGDSLALGSAPGGSFPGGSAAVTGSMPTTGSGTTGSGTTGGGSGGTASISGLAGVTGVTDGSGLSVAGESGLSLEDDDVQLSGIQLSGVDLSNAGFTAAEGSGIDLGAVGDDAGDVEGGTMLAGDAFELGAVSGDDESASVVIATDSESGDSSFFGATMIAGESSSSDDSSMQVATSGIQFPVETFAGTSFSALQICGLVSCSLLLLVGGFICFDLVRSIGSVRGAAFSTPILDSLTSTFGLK